MTDLRGFWKGEPTQKTAPAQDQKRKNKRAKRALNKRKRLAKKFAALDRILTKAGHRPAVRSSEYQKDDGFYKSEEWRRLRYLALKNNDGRCECCGASKADGVQLHVDHIKPRYTHPKLSLDLSNLQILCDDCNIGKGAWDSTDWREHMRSIAME